MKKPPPSLPPGTNALMGKRQVCMALDISTRTLQSMVSAGEFPAPDTRIGPHPKWRLSTVNSWIDQRCTAKG